MIAQPLPFKVGGCTFYTLRTDTLCTDILYHTEVHILLYSLQFFRSNFLRNLLCASPPPSPTPAVLTVPSSRNTAQAGGSSLARSPLGVFILLSTFIVLNEEGARSVTVSNSNYSTFLNLQPPRARCRALWGESKVACGLYVRSTGYVQCLLYLLYGHLTLTLGPNWRSRLERALNRRR